MAATFYLQIGIISALAAPQERKSDARKFG